MAGDWLKLESATPEKTEVLAITAAMGWDDPDLTVGKLFRVWRWFDQHTLDGNAPGVTVALLDRICGASGFASSMESVGWLVVTDGGITLPNFDRHNGKTAKARALTARRVNSLRSCNDDGNADSVTSPLPREEKRREEKIRGKKHLSVASPRAETCDPPVAVIQDESDERGELRQLSPQQQAVAIVLDAFAIELRPHAGLVARWIDQVAEGRNDPNLIAAAEAVREIVWKYPDKSADYIGKCVGTAAARMRSGEDHGTGRRPAAGRKIINYA